MNRTGEASALAGALAPQGSCQLSPTSADQSLRRASRSGTVGAVAVDQHQGHGAFHQQHYFARTLARARQLFPLQQLRKPSLCRAFRATCNTAGGMTGQLDHHACKSGGGGLLAHSIIWPKKESIIAAVSVGIRSAMRRLKPIIPVARKRLPRRHSLVVPSICFSLVPRHRIVSKQLGQMVVVGAQFVGRHVFEVQK
jgi:hypothetical protein